MNKYVLRNILILCSIIFILTIPQGVFAHAFLEKATPAADSQLQIPPNEIVLEFNERLEKELYSIKVFNEEGEMVSEGKTEISQNQKYITQSLPFLPNGNYAISYSVLSADGHPIEGSYVISIGEETVQKIDMNRLDIQEDDNESVLFGTLYSTVRILYYIALLLTTGWIVWGTVSKIEQAEIRTSYRQKALYLQIALFITTIGMGFLQFAELLNSWTLSEFWSVLTGTTIGRTWYISMILSVFGFALLFRNKWLDRLWVYLILVVKSANGHAIAFDPRIVTVLLDIIHLLAASIWAGGLLYILVYWKKQREHVQQFLSLFSKVALVSILVLIGTGVASTFIFLPQVDYLLFTQWGILLLIKVALVLLVIVIAGLLRYALKKKKEDSIGKLLKIDFTLMIIILGIVGVFTHLNPLPQNEPLEWHEREGDIEFTTTISPKVPGNNDFRVVANSRKEDVRIKNIELFLKYKDNPDVAPIQIPFSEQEQSKTAQYWREGQYLPFSGNWTAEIRILDSEDDEHVFSKDFMVY